MEYGKSHLLLQYLQIAIGLVVAYLVWQNGKRQVEDWLEALWLELEEPGPGCLASAIASWPLRILCIVAAVALLAQWLGADGAGSGSFA